MPMSTSSSNTSSGLNSGRRSIPFLLVVGFVPVFTAGLGTWQIQRLQWKLDMIQQLEDKLHKNPIGLPARIDLDAIPEFAYRKVQVEGTFDHAHEILIGPRTREGELGYHVITPLVRGEGKDTILVNRGFVKREKRDKRSRVEGLTSGQVQLVGMLRDQDRSNSFTPKNNPEAGEWVFSDIKQMAAFSGADPVLVDEIYNGNAGEIKMRLAKGEPVGRAATIELRNQHMTYAVTWYTLSLATGFMFYRLVRKPRLSTLSAAQFRGVS
ncbi:SURF1-domain-containing protein [Meredithblackwellia eburnea MCA 4105]